MGQTGSYTINKISLDDFQDDEFGNNLVIENEMMVDWWTSLESNHLVTSK